jgi:hypothetical protein
VELDRQASCGFIRHRGRQLYNDKFTLACTIAALRRADNESSGTIGAKESA